MAGASKLEASSNIKSFLLILYFLKSKVMSFVALIHSSFYKFLIQLVYSFEANATRIQNIYDMKNLSSIFLNIHCSLLLERTVNPDILCSGIHFVERGLLLQLAFRLGDCLLIFFLLLCLSAFICLDLVLYICLHHTIISVKVKAKICEFTVVFKHYFESHALAYDFFYAMGGLIKAQKHPKIGLGIKLKFLYIFITGHSMSVFIVSMIFFYKIYHIIPPAEVPANLLIPARSILLSLRARSAPI